jgi:hypothetical protein
MWPTYTDTGRTFDILKSDPFCCALCIRWLPSHPSRDACATGGPLAFARTTAFHGPEIFLEVNRAKLHHVRPSLSLSLDDTPGHHTQALSHGCRPPHGVHDHARRQVVVPPLQALSRQSLSPHVVCGRAEST